MQRYFASFAHNKIILDSGDIHHIVNVMRMKNNDRIVVIANNKEYLVNIDAIKPLSLSIVKELENNNELMLNITLFLALAKGDKIDFIIQKATELGVKNICLVRTRNCVVKMNDDDFKRKKERYYKIAKEASEQSERLLIPNIDGVFDINNIPSHYLKGKNLLAYERASDKDKIDITGASDVSIFIGPEGGFDISEVEALKAIGFETISLGKTILRVETAAISALSVIKYLAR